jgi:hypothetical protein
VLLSGKKVSRRGTSSAKATQNERVLHAPFSSFDTPPPDTKLWVDFTQRHFRIGPSAGFKESTKFASLRVLRARQWPGAPAMAVSIAAIPK